MGMGGRAQWVHRVTGPSTCWWVLWAWRGVPCAGGGGGAQGYGGVFAQRGHSANYYGDYPGNNPENYPPCGIMHNQFKTQKFKLMMLAMGPRDLNSARYSPVHCSSHSMTSFQSSELTGLPVVENSQLFAQRTVRPLWVCAAFPGPCLHAGRTKKIARDRGAGATSREELVTTHHWMARALFEAAAVAHSPPDMGPGRSPSLNDAPWGQRRDSWQWSCFRVLSGKRRGPERVESRAVYSPSTTTPLGLRPSRTHCDTGRHRFTVFSYRLCTGSGRLRHLRWSCRPFSDDVVLSPPPLRNQQRFWALHVELFCLGLHQLVP